MHGEELGLQEVTEIPDAERQDPTFFRNKGVEIGRDGCRVPLPWAQEGTSFGFGAGVNPPDGIGPTPNGEVFHGMAPQAKILAYKTCNLASACTGDVDLAIEDAASPFTLIASGTPDPQMLAKPVADVINLSLSSTSDGCRMDCSRSSAIAAPFDSSKTFRPSSDQPCDCATIASSDAVSDSVT